MTTEEAHVNIPFHNEAHDPPIDTAFNNDVTETIAGAPNTTIGEPQLSIDIPIPQVNPQASTMPLRKSEKIKKPAISSNY